MRNLLSTAFAGLAMAALLGAPAHADWRSKILMMPVYNAPLSAAPSAPKKATAAKPTTSEKSTATSAKKTRKATASKPTKAYTKASATKSAGFKSSGSKSAGGRGLLSGLASYYWQPQPVASGGRFNPNALTAAHKSLPFGTRVRVTNQRNGKSVVVKINDRGPYIKGRIIDLSKRAAGVIGMLNSGVVPVKVTIL